jgi:hypothetical protein
MTGRYIEESRGLYEKEVYSPVMPDEIVINKKGILGRLKVAFNFEHKNQSNVDSIFVKYRDITKRKFV